MLTTNLQSEIIGSENRDVIQPELLPGEILLWCGKPLVGVIFHNSDWVAIPFSLMWGGFSVFWEASVLGLWGNSHHAASPHLSFFALWGIPFVVIGQYIIWGRFFYTAWKKARTYYGLTTKRVIVVGTGARRTVTDGSLENLDSITLSEQGSGIGTIEFAPEPARKTMWGNGSRSRSGPQMNLDLSRLAFFDISEARSVYQQIQTAREQARRSNRGI